MAREIRAYGLTVPAGTLATAPVSKDMSFPPREVDSVEIVIPPGPNGTVGFALQNSHVTVIPYGSDEWIISNNEIMTWPLDGYIDSGDWQLVAWNNGTFDHSIYVRFLLSLPTPPGTIGTGVRIIDSDTLAGSI